MNTAINIANKILMYIGEAFLSDAEISKLPSSGEDLKAIYLALINILNERNVPQASLNKLQAKALLDGVELSTDESKKDYGSNILLGFGVDI